MEEISATNPEYQPLQVKFYGAPFCAPMFKKPSPWHPITHLLNKLYVPSLYQEQFPWSSSKCGTTVLCNTNINSFHPLKIFYTRVICFFLGFIFISHFSWACVTLCAFQNHYLRYSISCLPYNSLISSWIQAKYLSVLLLCMLYQTINFQHKANISINLY